MRRRPLSFLSIELWMGLSLMLFALYSNPTLAQPQSTTLSQLRDAGKLKLRTWIEPADNIVVGQELQLTIEVSTQRWFAGGTKIRYPDEKNLVILRRDNFANNLSEREGAITWVIQRWNLELYPQLAGSYRLPAITLELAVNDALAGVVRGSLETQAIEFEAAIPPALAALQDWVATPTLTVEHEIDREPTNLVPGDAFTRHITLRATHVTAMMLQPVVATALPGLPAYEDEPQLRNSSNRGEATAERRQSITYVVEQPGQYLLPEQVFYWWDTGAQELKSVVLPQVNVDAGMPASGPAESDTGPVRARIWTHMPEYWLPALALGIALGAGLILWRRRSQRVSEATLLRRINRALRDGQPELASRLLYDWLNLFQPQPDWYQLRAALGRNDAVATSEQIDALLATAYGTSREHATTRLPGLRAAGTNRLQNYWRKLLLPSVALQLNPDETQPR